MTRTDFMLVRRLCHALDRALSEMGNRNEMSILWVSFSYSVRLAGFQNRIQSALAPL